MNIFDQLSQWSHAYRVPCISPQTHEFLIETCLKHKPMHCCEIGTARGVSACTLGTILQTWNGRLITTEITYPDYRIACDTLSQNQLMGTVTPIYADALKISWERILTEQLDFLFVDGQKRQYGEYLERLWPFLRKGSQIILDDVIKFQSKLDSLYTFLSQKQIEYKIIQLEEDDGVMRIEKR